VAVFGWELYFAEFAAFVLAVLRQVGVRGGDRLEEFGY
jgi:hypothetical protein